MITEAMFWQIKKLSEIEKLSVRQIADKLELDHKTVTKWLHTAGCTRKQRTAASGVLDEYKDIIKSLLERHDDFSSVQLFQRIKDAGYTGGVTTVRNYVRRIRPSGKKAYATLYFAPGEAAQVDFGYCGYIYTGSCKRRLYVFSMVLAYSRKMYIEFIMKQNQEHFLQCHRNAFEYFGGIPQKVMVDNCKVAVLSNPKYGSAVLNPVYVQFANYHAFAIAPCAVRKPNEKGQVEKSIDYIKRNFLRGLEITTLTALNFAAGTWLNNIANVRVHSTTRQKPNEMFMKEANDLLPLPLNGYDCGIIKNIKSNSQFRVHFEGNRYSVPALYASCNLQIKIYPAKLIFFFENKTIARHERSYDSNKDIVDDNHNKEFLKEKRKAKTQKELLEFFRISPDAEKYYHELIRVGRSPKIHIRKILALKEIYSTREVALAITDCLECKAVSSEFVQNLIEARRRILPKANPLHVTRNSDCLEIKINRPDLNLYSINQGA
ncbi:MAG: IS21 family transposase [Desulfosarcina sp.]|nr:IS21 family transposase [Desulfobacterales bacterium]